MTDLSDRLGFPLCRVVAFFFNSSSIFNLHASPSETYLEFRHNAESYNLQWACKCTCSGFRKCAVELIEPYGEFDWPYLQNKLIRTKTIHPAHLP